ncbi:MAG: hypothetical protein KBH07_06990 [Flavobacteriales bacterium]|nr:hypothetical protein [Flavobacteriales bacterium]MBP9079721.1 hypothetical protein [Flavobacteriales bacterium]
MKPDRDTYEAWLLDRMEGRLTAAQETALDAFLRNNPDLRPYAGDLPNTEGEPLEFPGKDLLRKTYPPTGKIDAMRLDDFLVARLEKDLGTVQEKQLERYLYEHPEAERLAALMAMAKVPNTAIPFTEKETVERHFPPKGMPDAHRLTDFLIAELEGDLSTEQQQALRQFIADNNEAQHQQKLVTATRVVPEALVYPDKAGSKKREARVVALWPKLAAAASIALLLSAAWWLLRERPTDIPETARAETTVKSVAPPPHDGAVAPVDVVQPSRTEVPENATGESSNAGALPKMKPHDAFTPKEQPRSNSSGQEPEQFQSPIPVPQRVPSPLPIMEPELAQRTPELKTLPADTAQLEYTSTARPAEDELAMAGTHGTDQSLGAFVANAFRNDVLDKPQRTATLDGDDALALADKALGAVTGGHGGVMVQRTSERERFRLHLGRNFSISASRER